MKYSFSSTWPETSTTTQNYSLPSHCKTVQSKFWYCLILIVQKGAFAKTKIYFLRSDWQVTQVVKPMSTWHWPVSKNIWHGSRRHQNMSFPKKYLSSRHENMSRRHENVSDMKNLCRYIFFMWNLNLFLFWRSLKMFSSFNKCHDMFSKCLDIF